MTHEAWIGKLDAYLDGELASAEAVELDRHLQECAACTAEGLRRLQWKQAVKSAGQRYVVRTPLSANVARTLARSRTEAGQTLLRTQRWWRFATVALAVVCVFAAATIYRQNVRQTRNNQLLSELVDLHVSALASANPVDVVSTDRHTVKPWFAGKVPFSFDLPELEGTPFELAGGRVCYLEQSPGAELLFRVRKHLISVFIFREDAVPQNLAGAGPIDARSFHLETFTRDGLHYFVIGDVGKEDLRSLATILKM